MNKRSKQEKEKRHRIKMEEKRAMMHRQNSTMTLTIEGTMPTEQQYEAYLESEAIDNKISNLKNMDLNTVSDDEIRNAVTGIVSYTSDSIFRVSFLQGAFTRFHNGNLYRVRICEDNCLSTMKTWKDAWNPPSEYVNRRGRINEVRESMLYVAADPTTAIKEMRIVDNQCFWMIVYDIQQVITVSDIASFQDTHQENDPHATIQKKVAELLHSEFTRDAVNENEYRISNIIAKFHYSLSLHGHDGWSYPSAVDVGKRCLCLDPDRIKDKLSLTEVLHCSLSDGKIVVKAKAFLDEKGHFVHA